MRLFALALPLSSWGMEAGAAGALRCELSVPPQGVAGQPVPLRLTLTNTGRQPLQLLRWNTPFEGRWAAPFVRVLRAGRALEYHGPQFKRGDPSIDDYLALAPGQSGSAEIDLALPYDLARAGRYDVRPALALLDLAPLGSAPRRRDAFTPHALHCNRLRFELSAKN